MYLWTKSGKNCNLPNVWMQNYVKGRNQFFFIKMSSIRVVSYRDPPLIFFDDFSFWDISFFFLPAPFLLLAYSAYINVSNNDVVMHFRILWSFTKYTTPPPPTVNIDDLTHSGKQRKKLFIPMAGLYSFLLCQPMPFREM